MDYYPAKANFCCTICILLCLSIAGCKEVSHSHEHFHNFELDPFWPPTSVKALQYYGSAVSVSNHGVVVLHRSDSMTPAKQNSTQEPIQEDVILILEPISGIIQATWGRNKFCKPHGMEIDEEGNIFISDVRMHQVFKFARNESSGLWTEEPVLILGEKFVSGQDSTHFCSPADIAIMSDTKDIYIADGYCNSRVVVFNEFGLYIGEFGAGSQTSLSPLIQFNVTHALAIATPCDLRSGLPILIFVADRNNGRIQCFTKNGTFLYEISSENFHPEQEMLMSLTYSKSDCYKQSLASSSYGMLYAVNGHMPFGQPEIFELAITQMNFNVINTFPVSISEESSSVENDIISIETPHDIAISKDGRSMYVIEALNSLTVKKFIIRSMTSSASPLFVGYFILTFLCTLMSIFTYVCVAHSGLINVQRTRPYNDYLSE